MKKFLILALTCAIMGTTNCTAFASSVSNDTNTSTTITETEKINTLDDLLNSDLSEGGQLLVGDEVPEDVQAKEFDTWEEAYDYLNDIKEKTETQYVKTNKSLLPNRISLYSSAPTTDYYTVKTAYFSGTGSDEYVVDHDLPGATFQVVSSTHYIEYSGGAVTSSSRSSDISGAGIASWTQTYSGLQKYSSDPAYKSIIRGRWGYYVTVSGQRVGYSYTLELQLRCVPN